MITERFKKIVEIETEENTFLTGDLDIPENASSLIVFAHGSGSSRLSPRNKLIANYLQKANFATLLFDLLTGKEDQDMSKRFDIELLSSRLFRATEWVKEQPGMNFGSIGYFGASTGAAAALKASTFRGNTIKAIVSRGGRPDLAIRDIPAVTAAVRLIIGSKDEPVITLNERAYNLLDPNLPKDIKIVQGASHLFEEAGKLEEAAQLALEWFSKYLI